MLKKEEEIKAITLIIKEKGLTKIIDQETITDIQEAKIKINKN